MLVLLAVVDLSSGDCPQICQDHPQAISTFGAGPVHFVRPKGWGTRSCDCNDTIGHRSCDCNDTIGHRPCDCNDTIGHRSCDCNDTIGHRPCDCNHTIGHSQQLLTNFL